MKIKLQKVPFDKRSDNFDLPKIPAKEYKKRLTNLYKIADADWVVVYGDREHYANLTYLINFDPRFEEVLLVLGPDNSCALVVGNEDMNYGSVLPFPVDMVLSQTLSLPGQKRNTAPSLMEVFTTIGIKTDQTVSLVGWKYLEPFETDSPDTPSFVPAFIVHVLEALIKPKGKVVDGTALLMHPEFGLRATNSCDQIAAFEWAACESSAAIFRILRGARPGMSEMEAMALMDYSGLPMTMHPIFTSGNREINGLRSASNRIINYGDGVSTAVGYWGSLVCRAGLMQGEVDQLFVDETVKPYYSAIVTWYQTMQIGITGDEVYRKVLSIFEGTGIEPSLNPGHLTSYDEWLHSPIRLGSNEKIRSGMMFQVDIIPAPLKPGQMMNCEDTVCIADSHLRAELKANYPEMWRRIKIRRKHMVELLGIKLNKDILPLTDRTAYLPPFWLSPDLVCVVAD